MNDILIPGTLFFAYISFLWWLGLRCKNAGLIDFGWPSGFTALALYYCLAADGHWQRKAIITAMYCFCGVRFMVGWTVRNLRDGEDRRWTYIRDRWIRGDGLLAIRSVPLNLFAFYHAQTFATLFFLIRPLIITCNNQAPTLYAVEWIAIAFWTFSYIMENVADYQLDRFRRSNSGRGRVCQSGLWKYSRHPNYFFEFLIWTAYALFAIPSINHWMDLVAVAFAPFVAYWFLVHITGIPIAEHASRHRRGEEYAKYQATTNRFFPGFQRTSSNRGGDENERPDMISGGLITHRSTCPLCEAMCGIKVETRGAEVVSIRGDADDPLSNGYICPKATALRQLHEDPDRLRFPVRREGETWQPITWSEAINETAHRISEIQKRDGEDSVGIYLGNPTIHNLGATIFGPSLVESLNSRNRFSPTSADQLPHMFVSYLMFGHQLLLPIPDVDRTDFMLIIGGNPLVSNGSLMSAPNMRKRLKAIQNRGGKFVVVDPRKTETANLADKHMFIRPATDAFFLLSILHCILRDARRANLDQRFRGWDDIVAMADEFPPETTEATTGIAASEVRKLAEEFLTRNKAVCYGRIGTSTQTFGGLATWLVALVNIASGNFDRAGGYMFTSPAIDLVDPKYGIERGGFDRWRSRVRGLPEFSGELPVSTIADEILEEGEGQIRAMITSAGNPILSAPNGNRLDQAFGSLEFMVSIDPYINETTRHADIILPPVSPLERENYDLVFRLLAVRNTSKYSPPIFPVPKEGLHDWQIMHRLQSRLEDLKFGWRPMRAFKRWWRGFNGPKGLLSLALWLGQRSAKRNGRPFGFGIKQLERRPEGIDLGPLRPCLFERMPSNHEFVELAPKLLLDDVERLKKSIRTANHVGDDQLLLIGRRHLRSNNSWLHNSPKMISGKQRCTLIIHPNDAENLGIENGTAVRVTSSVGSVHTFASVSDEIMQGVVSLPHGFGHNRPGVKLGVARKHPGVSFNDLMDETRIDELCGNAAFCGLPVSVRTMSDQESSSY